MRTLI